MCNTQVIKKKEQLEKNHSELIQSIEERERHHFERRMAIDVPILLLGLLINAFARMRGDIKEEGLGLGVGVGVWIFLSASLEIVSWLLIRNKIYYTQPSGKS